MECCVGVSIGTVLQVVKFLHRSELRNFFLKPDVRRSEDGGLQSETSVF